MSDSEQEAWQQQEFDDLKARVVELEAVYEHAKGLCFGSDWNNGTHARIHRQKLEDAVAALGVK